MTDLLFWQTRDHLPTNRGGPETEVLMLEKTFLGYQLFRVEIG